MIARFVRFLVLFLAMAILSATCGDYSKLPLTVGRIANAQGEPSAPHDRPAPPCAEWVYVYPYWILYDFCTGTILLVLT